MRQTLLLREFAHEALQRALETVCGPDWAGGQHIVDLGAGEAETQQALLILKCGYFRRSRLPRDPAGAA